jgi:glycerol-1-phosphate dehydrogenase [NAD(P)+]
MVEASCVDELARLGSCTVVAHDPPWSQVSTRVPAPAEVIGAWDMDIAHLERLADAGCKGDVIVGLGGGTALDTAKFLAWRLGRPLVQVPSITSVDAGFTEAVGVRVDGNVRYVGAVRPERVVLDVDLVRGAPAHLNRAGVGDIISCATGLHDWRLAADQSEGPAWDEELAALGRSLLVGVVAHADDVRAVTPEAVRFMASSYRAIGAACADAGHSRFEEGSEHFWAYAYESLTGAHPIHGEIISFAVVVMSSLQGNDASSMRDLVARCGVRAHPDDIGVTRADYDRTWSVLRRYVRDNSLDVSVIDEREFSAAELDAAWHHVASLPRVGTSDGSGR